MTAHFSSLKGDPSDSNWTVLDFYGIVKGVIIVAFTTMITLWIGLPWSGLFIISRPLVESSSVLHQLERWVICHWPPQNSASSTLCYKFTSSSYTVEVYCHSAADGQGKLIYCLYAGVRAGWWRVCVWGGERSGINPVLNCNCGHSSPLIPFFSIYIESCTISGWCAENPTAKRLHWRFSSLLPESKASQTTNKTNSLIFLICTELFHSNVRG